MKNIFTILTLASFVCLSNVQSSYSQYLPAPSTGNHVLILSSTITPTGEPGGCKEAAAVIKVTSVPDITYAYTIHYATPAQWPNITQADFLSYRAIIFGDNTCDASGTGIEVAAELPQLWAYAVNTHVLGGLRQAGNVYIISTDPVFHYYQNGGDGGKSMIENGMCHVLSGTRDSYKTGAYICLSCYYNNTNVPTEVPILSQIGSSPFKVNGSVCFENTHVTATTTGCDVLDNDKIKNWGCSVNQPFIEWDQLNFQVVAMAVTGSSYTAPDGTVGMPYILARGANVISDIVLTPPVVIPYPIGSPNCVTATVATSVPVEVTFTILEGPCGARVIPGGPYITDMNGQVTACYTNCGSVGIDYINAQFTISGVTQTSNVVQTLWEFPLPVELSSFTASVNHNNVTLNWTTSSEENNSGFSIERSSVSGQWNSVGQVDGHGNSSNPVNYSYTDRNVTSGKYSYRLKQLDFNGNFEYFNLNNEVNIGVPTQFNLSQNYPNPFNPSTKIDFELPKDGNVSILVYDNGGKQVTKLVDGFRTAGFYTTEFNSTGLSSGIYFYKADFKAGDQSFVKVLKMSLIK